MKIRSLLLLSHLIIFAFFGCNSSSNSQSSKKQELPGKSKTDSSDLYTVIKFTADQDYLFPKNYKNSNLTKSDIVVLDSITHSAILEYNSDMEKNHSLAIQDLKEYRQQFVVVINNKGQKLVYVNCFRDWEYFEKKWKKEIIEVSDGGSNFFNLIINLSTKTYYRLTVNGLA